MYDYKQNIKNRYYDLVRSIDDVKKEIQENGGVIKNGEVVFKKDNLYVVESYIYGESKYEDFGYFRLIHQLRSLDDETVSLIKSIKHDNHKLKDFMFKYYNDQSKKDKLSVGYNIINDIGVELSKENISHICTDEEYFGTKDFLFEAFVSDKFNLWQGYFSFFSIDIESFNKFKQEEVNCKKFLTYN